MTTTIDTVTVQDAYHRITVEVTTDVDVEWWGLTRYYAGSSGEPVRGDNPDNSTQFTANGPSRTLYDVEAPRGVPVTYTASASPSGGPVEVSAVSAAVSHDVTDCNWWVHPVSLPRHSATFEPESQTNQAHQVAHGQFQAIGRDFPIVLFGTRSAHSGTLTARAGSFDAIEELAHVFGHAEVLVVRAPPVAGWSASGRRYVAVHTISYSRLGGGPSAPAGPVSAWSLDLPWVEVEPPSSSIVTFGATYADILAGFADYQAVADAFLTYDDLLAWVP